MVHQVFTTVAAEKDLFCLSWFAMARGQLLGHSNQSPGSRQADTGARPRFLYEIAQGDNLRSSPDGGLVDLRLLSIEGAAANGIISYAQTAPGAVIVISTHGRSGVQRWILGSVTEKIVRHADDPVLVLRDE